MSNMGKGAGYYLTRSKSLLIDTAIVAILAIFMSFAMQMDALQSKGEDYLVLMLYAVIFGLTSLQSGAMIVDLTAKDKLSRRIEFFVASGIAVKEIIKQYSIQIFRFSGIIPFFVFMSCYYFTDWTMSFGRIVCVYLSIIVIIQIIYFIASYTIRSTNRKTDDEVERAIQNGSIMLVNQMVSYSGKGDFVSANKVLKLLKKIQKERR